MADSNSIDTFVHTLTSNYQKIDILINSAGVSVEKSKFDIDAFNWTFKTVNDKVINIEFLWNNRIY